MADYAGRVKSKTDATSRRGFSGASEAGRSGLTTTERYFPQSMGILQELTMKAGVNGCSRTSFS
jgi:hypothetical protein